MLHDKMRRIAKLRNLRDKLMTAQCEADAILSLIATNTSKTEEEILVFVLLDGVDRQLQAITQTISDLITGKQRIVDFKKESLQASV